MAKQPTSKGGTSRIRFIMLEAEIPDGQLADVTAAIQNALKPAVVTQPRLPAQVAPAAQIVDARANGELLVSETGEDFAEDAEETTPTKTNPPRSRKVSKPSSPKVIPDLDLKSGVSFEDYVAQYPPKSDLDRNLVVAAYFQENRPDQEGVTVHHVYTCYRVMKWPTNIADFSWALQRLKRQQLLTGGPSRGTYVINHLGVARVHELAGGGS